VNKLLGGESKIGNLNLDDINIQKMEDSDLHFLIVDIEVELKKNNIEDNIFIAATDEEIAESINKIDIVFKILEDRILKTLSNRENIRQEIIEIKHDQEKIRKELESRLLEVKEEYQNIMKDYEGEEDNNYFKLDSPEEYNIYVRDLLKDFYGYLNKDFIKKKEEIDEYNFIDKVVKPTILNIKDKEKQIDHLLLNLEKYGEEDPSSFNKCINVIKNENKLRKYNREKKNREIQLKLKNDKIMDKFNKIFVKERNKFKMLEPLSIFEKSKNIVKELKTESADFKLIYY
jgi:hypothetical protein